ncbi:MAG: YfaZ family protein [Gammaproteobacteria bacterium]|nr:YfaZ family protein [Gammaproteobacteria bacterium]
MYRIILLLATLLTSSMAWAGSIDASINDNSVNITVGWVKNQRTPDAMQVQLGYMHNLQGNRFLSAGLHVIGETGQSDNPIELGIGGKFMGIDSNTSGGLYGLTIGVEMRYYPKSINRLAFSGQFYYGPNVVVSNPASSFQEFGIRAEYQILPQAFTYIGYRTLGVGLAAGGSDNIDNGVHVGFRILLQ